MAATPSKIKMGSVELNLKVTPLQYTVEKSYSYSVDHCIGQIHPLVSFEHGSVKTLSLSLILDEDLDDQINVGDIAKLLTEIDKVEAEYRTTQEMEVSMGPFKFKGFVVNYKYSPSRFRSDMTPTSIKLDISLISSPAEEGPKA